LVSPLEFDHLLHDTILENENGKKLKVGTRHHIGWLSRRIVVTSERTNGGTGCNNIPGKGNFHG